MDAKPADMTWTKWFRDCHPGFGRPVDDLSVVPREVVALAINGKTKHVQRLTELPDLRRLSVREIGQAHLDIIGTLTELRELRVFGFRGADVGPISRLENLDVLRFEWAPKIESIDALAPLLRLQHLTLGDMKRVSRFDVLAGLVHVKSLSISSAVDGKLQAVESLAPLTALTALEELWICADVADHDFDPVTRMPWLQHLSIANVHPLDVYAKLAAYLTGTQCEAFEPVQRYLVNDQTRLMLTGRPVRYFAADDPKAPAAVARRVAEFERLKAAFAAEQSQHAGLGASGAGTVRV